MLIKIYKGNNKVAEIKEIAYFFHYNDGTLILVNEDKHEYVYAREDYDWYYVLR